MFRLFPITYTRPPHVPPLPVPDAPPRPGSPLSQSSRPANPSRPSNDSLPEDSKAELSIRSGRSGCSAGIPDSLAFDNIMNGGTCPVSMPSLWHLNAADWRQPMTVRDFMNYLVYVEHAAENLQFWLWYKDYAKRFNAAATADVGLAPVWTQSMQDDVVARIRKEYAEKRRPEPQAAKIFKGTDFEKQTGEGNGSNPFSTPPHTPHKTSEDKSSVCTAAKSMPSSVQPTHKLQAASAFAAAGPKQPCTCVPWPVRTRRRPTDVRS